MFPNKIGSLKCLHSLHLSWFRGEVILFAKATKSLVCGRWATFVNETDTTGLGLTATPPARTDLSSWGDRSGCRGVPVERFTAQFKFEWHCWSHRSSQAWRLHTYALGSTDPGHVQKKSRKSSGPWSQFLTASVDEHCINAARVTETFVSSVFLFFDWSIANCNGAEDQTWLARSLTSSRFVQIELLLPKAGFLGIRKNFMTIQTFSA